jgi:NADH-quinone oxidoreductase subunit I
LFNNERKIFTLYYPEERVKYPDAYRGRPVLVLGDNGVEKCVACGLCEKMCPALCISIQPGETKLSKERYPEGFTIDQARCIVCGFCEEVCPKEAILMSQDIEIANYDRKEILYKKEDLLVPEKDLRMRQGFVRGAFARWNY